AQRDCAGSATVNAYKTLGAGLSATSGGDTLTVRSGTYNEDGSASMPAGTSGQRTVVRGAIALDGVKPVIMVSGETSGYTISGDFLDVQDLIFDGTNCPATSTIGHGGVFQTGGTDTRIMRLELRNGPGVGVQANGQRMLFDGLYIHNNGRIPSNIYGPGAPGMYLYIYDSIIQNTVIHDQKGAGIRNFFSGDYPPYNNYYNVHYRNNTI